MITKKQLKKLVKEIVEGLNVDRTKDHLSDLQIKSQILKTKTFKIDDMEYRVNINETTDDNGVLLLSTFGFINVTAGKNVVRKRGESLSAFADRFQQTKTGLTGTGKQFRLFTEIYNIFIKYLEKFKPKFVGYVAMEDNRQKLYYDMMNRATKQSGLKFGKRLDKNPTTYEPSKQTEFYFEVGYL